MRRVWRIFADLIRVIGGLFTPFLAQTPTLDRMQTWQIGIGSYLQILSMILSRINYSPTESLLTRQLNVSFQTFRFEKISDTPTGISCSEPL